MQLHSAEQNSALRIPTFSLYLELPDLLRQPFDAILIFPRQVVDFLHGVVNLLNACRTSLAGCTYCV